MNSFTLFLVAVLAMVVTSQILEQVQQPVPRTLAEAMTVATGTYSAHFKKLPGKIKQKLNRNIYEAALKQFFPFFQRASTT